MGENQYQKIPSFDGAPEHLASYRDEALAYTFTLEIHKRYLAGPRLAQNLRGVAKTVIRRKLAADPQWLAHPRGAYTLIEFLEQAIEQPTLIQATHQIQKFFYQVKRKKGETMTEWVNRHAESAAFRALKRVEDEYVVGTNRTTNSSSSSAQGESNRSGWNHSGWWRQPETSQESQIFDDHGRIPEDDEIEPTEASQYDHQGSWNHWNWGASGWSQDGWSSWRSAEYQPPQAWQMDVPDFLPDYLVGFLLLQRSNLDALERANVLAAIRGVFSVRSVERALKEQWSDEDLSKRDRSKFQAMVTFDEDDDEALTAEQAVPDFGEDYEAEGAFWAEQTAIDAALTAIQEQKRTLKDARWRQNQARMGRKFYPLSKGKGSEKGKGKGKEARDGIKCLKCGGPHSTDNCPVRRAQVADEHAEVAFSCDVSQKQDPDQLPAECVWTAQTPSSDLHRTILEGKGVIDCGATATLGSVSAVESLMALNQERCGEDRVSVDPSVRPVFKFGNNSAKSCISTVDLGVDLGDRKGKMQVHVHDVANQPVLVSIKALKALGAVLDFESNEVVYKKVCPKSVVPLEAAANGHLLMPLGGDLLKGAIKRKEPLASLKDE